MKLTETYYYKPAAIDRYNEWMGQFLLCALFPTKDDQGRTLWNVTAQSLEETNAV